MDEKADGIRTGEIYAGYAADEEIRFHASSGGIVSSILIDMLAGGGADGALVSRMTSIDGEIGAETNLVKERGEILLHGGSSYIDTPVLDAAARLHGFGGRAVVVCLPCQARALRKMLYKKPDLEKRIGIIIALFCRGSVEKKFYEDLFAKYGLDRAGVDSIKVRRGHRKGTVTVSYRSGGTGIIPFETMNAYRIAGIHSPRRCLWCDEHMGREADIAVGDIFTYEFKKRGIKHSAIVCWSDRGAQLVDDLKTRGIVEIEYFGMKRYEDQFRGVLEFGDRLGPRFLAAGIAGAGSRGRPPLFFNLFHTIAWTLVFLNSRMSRSSRGRRFLFGLPSCIVRLEALGIKALSRIRM